jgi:hypothetical protein
METMEVHFDSEPDRTLPWRPEELDFLDIDSEQGMQDDEYSPEGYVWSEGSTGTCLSETCARGPEMEVIEEDVFQTPA